MIFMTYTIIIVITFNPHPNQYFTHSWLVSLLFEKKISNWWRFTGRRHCFRARTPAMIDGKYDYDISTSGRRERRRDDRSRVKTSKKLIPYDRSRTRAETMTVRTYGEPVVVIAASDFRSGGASAEGVGRRVNIAECGEFWRETGWRDGRVLTISGWTCRGKAPKTGFMSPRLVVTVTLLFFHVGRRPRSPRIRQRRRVGRKKNTTDACACVVCLYCAVSKTPRPRDVVAYVP